MSQIIHDSEEELVTLRYFSTVNNTVGSVALAVAVSLLQFKKPESLAVGAIIIFSFWAFSQGYEYRSMLRRLSPQRKPSSWVFIRHGWLFIISIVMFSLIASGVLTNQMFN